MTTETSLVSVADVLRARIDEIATNLLVEGSLPAGRLEPVAAEAERNGFPDAAAAARVLICRVDAAGLDESAQQQAWCDGLNGLRRAVDEEQSAAESRQSPAISEPAAASFANDLELVGDFLVEAREHLARIESQALALEKDPADLEVIHSVFRTFHTIKGLAGFLSFAAIQEVAHETETLLDRARNRKLTIGPPEVDLVLESADYLTTDLRRIEAQTTGAPAAPAADNGLLIGKIRQILAAPHATAPSEPPLDAPNERQGTDQANAVPPPVADPPPAQNRPATPAAASESARPGESFSVRVDTVKLDRLLDMVGEMVIAQSLIRHNPVLAASSDARLLADIAQLSRSTADVQRTTMSMRMVSIGQLFQRTARLVRDLSRKAGKQIALETSGEDTEVDKTIAEALSDPLLHMVRNSVDHGIESPQERIAAGKDPLARIRLKAYHQAGQIVIEIGDDGRGLNREKILAKATQKGIVAADARPSDPEIFALIFEPGFSTAEKVTDVSGRGVGMDVVRRNVQKLRGRIDTHSVAGQGATFLIKLPLTLAIIEGLVVVVGSSRYIVPIFAVKEMFRPTPELLSTVQGRHEMALVRGNLLPIIRLHRRFQIPSSTVDPCQGLLVVAECDGQRFCLLVDDLVGKQEVVIKSLGETFKDVSGLAGCAILGDGRVGLILDMEGIYRGGDR
jgi:two-component system chemotaxis sensor kinase CheA